MSESRNIEVAQRNGEKPSSSADLLRQRSCSLMQYLCKSTHSTTELFSRNGQQDYLNQSSAKGERS